MNKKDFILSVVANQFSKNSSVNETGIDHLKQSLLPRIRELADSLDDEDLFT